MQSNRFHVILSVLIFLSLPISAQELFNSILSESESSQAGKLSLGGFTRGTIFTGWDYQDKAEIKSGYGETALKMEAKPNKWGHAFADIRFKSGFYNGDQNSILDIREAYADIYLGKFDFRFGKQIKSWGRADVFNPSQNLTPYDYFQRSPFEDDRRLGNLVLTGRVIPASFLRIELDWVPFYTPSIYRFDQISMPDFVSFDEADLPHTHLSNSSFGAKIDIILSKLECSFSFFNGYDPLMGLVPGALPLPPFNDLNIELLAKPFRQSSFGTDLAFNIGGFGIRGEAVLKKPVLDELNPSVPMEEINWVVGIDRAFGAFRILLEYNGKKMQDFEQIDPPGEFDPAMLQDPANWIHLQGLLSQQIGYYNRILFDQTMEWMHTIVARPSVSLFHETLELEAACLYNFSTEEYMLRPKLSYQVADNIDFIAGYEYYNGPENTRFDWIKRVFNGPFIEIRVSY